MSILGKELKEITPHAHIAFLENLLEKQLDTIIQLETANRTIILKMEELRKKIENIEKKGNEHWDSVFHTSIYHDN